MNFLSTSFIVFVLITLLLYISAPRKIKPSLLLVASLIFYGSLRLSFLALMVVQIIFAYGCALCLDKHGQPGRKRIFIFSFLGILSPLLIFKYFNFFLQTASFMVQAVAHRKALPVWNLILPAGISFYTFKSLSYIIDVYRGKMPAERDPLLVGLHISFFPQIMAGPIERAGHFMTQLRRDHAYDIPKAVEGLKLIVWGLFKKLVIADRLAQYVAIVFDRPQAFSDLSLIFGMIFYSFQIYCDFSGYSDMAIGLAQMMGIETMENFKFPYFSRNIPEFWSRWHISLSSWLRDYLFLPISYGLSRRIKPERFFLMKTDLFLYSCGMGLTMLLCGLWHGASWTFIVWGAIHGLYLISSRATRKIRRAALRFLHIRKSGLLWSGVRTFFTFSLVSLAWVVFRLPSLDKAWIYLSNISFRLPQRGLSQLTFLGSLVAVFVFLEFLLKNRQKISFWVRIPAPVRLMAWAFFLCLIVILAADTSNEFLYFQF